MSKYFSYLLILIVVIFFTNFSFAFFTDEETKQANGFEVGTLDFSLDQIATSSLSSITPSQSGHLDLVVEKEGSLDFQYQIKTSDLSGELCDYLNIKANLGGDFKEQDLLSGFSYQASSTQTFKDWSFEFSLASQDESLFQKSCSFKLLFEAWQLNLENNSQGFYKNRELELTLSSGTWRSGVFLNEFLPNPIGSDSLVMPEGEWVELYNTSDQPIDVAGWHINDETDHAIAITATNTLPATTIVGAKDWLVVYLNHSVLNNTSGSSTPADIVYLYDNANTLIDSYSYHGTNCELSPTPQQTNSLTTSSTCNTVLAVPENKSYARIPDGTGAWYDPAPTMGSVNKLNNDQN
ncbi:MAG: lamin tail domain-containing protein [Candidatus Paceibacterota bacterium]|jgi:hypothetical protein